MQVKTYLFGEVQVAPEQVITFPDGLTGFEHAKRYMLIHEENDGSPISFTLQSLDDGAVAFQIIDPAAIGFSYELMLTDEDSAKLQSPKSEDLAVMILVYKRDDEGNQAVGAGIRSPIIINTKARIAIQKIIERPRPNITISNLASPV